MPSEIETRINVLPDTWRVQNEMVPCTIYDKNEADLVDKIVTLTHGKGQKAGRDDWETVARARHNHQVNAAPEYGLILLEKYLEHGQNHSSEQKLRWSGKYNLSVLNEALPKIYERVDCTSVMELAQNYPNIKYKKELESVIYAIGLEELKFPDIRTSSDFLIRYGFPPLNTKKIHPTPTQIIHLHLPKMVLQGIATHPQTIHHKIAQVVLEQMEPLRITQRQITIVLPLIMGHRLQKKRLRLQTILKP